MINKTKTESKIQLGTSIANKYGLGNLSANFDKVFEHSKTFSAHAVVIGGYNAGKSALLNKYIGRYVLEEAQKPETNIAAELEYAPVEKIVATMLDGTRKEIIDVMHEDVTEMRNVTYYLNSENLRQQTDFILVDTPGFDSGVEQHNKALLQYLNKDTGYILVVDCEKGSISESTIQFIDEITNYSDNFAVILSKCDKQTDEDIEEVKEYISDALLSITGKRQKIESTSIFDPQVVEKINSIINSFNAQILYDANVSLKLNKEIELLIRALETIRDKAECDTTELDKEIEKRQAIRSNIEERLKKEKKKLSEQLHNNTKENIIHSINTVLQNHVDDLASSFKSGPEVFKERIVSLLRPVLIQEMENVSFESYEHIIDRLDLNGLANSTDIEGITEIVMGIYEKLKLSDRHTKCEDGAEMGSTTMGTYKIISTILAITTDIVAKPLELIIVFLPEIIKLIGMFLGQSQDQKLTDAIRNKVIPEILRNFRNELDEPLTEIQNLLIENIENSINELLNVENEAISNAMMKKQELEDNYTKYLSDIDDDIALLKE